MKYNKYAVLCGLFLFLTVTCVYSSIRLDFPPLFWLSGLWIGLFTAKLEAGLEDKNNDY